MTENKAPKIRFKGFTDDWEQRKLGEVYKERKEKGNNKLQILSVSIHSGVSDNELSNETLGKEVKRSEDKSLYKHVFPGDLVFNMMRAWQGAIGVVKNEGMVSPAYIVAKPDIDLYPRFMNYYFQRNSVISQLNNLSYGVTDFRKRLYWDSFIKAFVYIPPDKEEQKEISDLLDNLSSTLALHQRKLELLKQLKQGYLQKMFPQQGEKIPKIRFVGFCGNWKQYKLGEITQRVRGNDGRMELPTLTISAGSGWLDQRDRFAGNIAGKEQKNYTLLKKGQLSYNHGNSKLAKYGAVFELKNRKEALVPRVYHSFETNNLANASFIEYVFATKIPDRELGKLVSSGARMDGLLNINYDDFMGINIKVPSVNEQEKIGGFLKTIDDNINFYIRKVCVLENIKKEYLKALFI